jgi:hypothetical protein
LFANNTGLSHADYLAIDMQRAHQAQQSYPTNSSVVAKCAFTKSKENPSADFFQRFLVTKFVGIHSLTEKIPTSTQ